VPPARLEPPHRFSCTPYASRNSALPRRASYQTRKGLQHFDLLHVFDL
jgi:hypothetical protein